MTSTTLLESPTPFLRDSESLYEVIDGVEVDQPRMSMESIELANDLNWHINSHARPAGLGKARIEMLIELPLDGRTRDRRPDVIFVSAAKWPEGSRRVADNAWKIVPEICIEIISPSDKFYEMDEKIAEYFEAGVSQVWVVYPPSRMIEIYRSPSEYKALNDRETLTCEEILPGFRLPLAEYFG